ncbi:hypothetical protein K469DRAFT_703816 [Zopfia rhizophila CBS 207.26]|uniref:Uncharacterized protein n=1 Tax=Zopfia rhizophila CBS 207.26 TaxID=1314779 RepID=A0A6A6E8U3_9PEZI|nr:hypothetical protein K469DRAFT_703816 [Zopfia rhizophila CBS 207.26]
MIYTQMKELAQLLLRLPRELRDMIYPNIIIETKPIPLISPSPHSLTSPTQSNSTIATEAMEAFYTYNTFVVNLSPDSFADGDSWGSDPGAKLFLRNIIVYGSEVLDPLAPQTPQEFEELYSNSLHRWIWESLLSLPKLEKLEIRLMKKREGNIDVRDLAPIIHALRERWPNIDITVSVSFDDILSEAWYDPFWATFNGGEENPYQAAGYIDVSDFFCSPSDEDRRYVEEYLPRRKMPMGRNARLGLLDHSPQERRALGVHYVVKEPALFRVMMEEHYQVYKKCKESRYLEKNA